MRIFSTIFGVLAFLILLMTLFGGFYTVNDRERAVVLANGAFSEVAQPGFHLKRPWIDDVVTVSLESHKAVYKDMEAYSRDQQAATLRVSVLYHVPPDQVQDVYRRYASTENMEAKVIESKVNEQTKNVFGQFDAVTAVQERVRLNAQIAASIHDAIKGLNAPLVVEAVQIEDMQFSAAYMGSIEQRMQAAVEVDRYKQNLDREKIQADIAIEQARGRAESSLAEARANAKATELRGAAEAGAIRARAEALGSNPALVGLTTAEKWDGRLPSTMVPGAAVPMLSLGK